EDGIRAYKVTGVQTCALPILVTTAGNYSVSMVIPGTPDTISKKFVVKESNPELDNLTPDFDQLRQLASDATEVLARVSDPIKAKIGRASCRERVRDPAAGGAA